jgi:hypothetical protein
MNRFSARGYLIRPVRLSRDEADALLDEAERDGKAVALVAEAERREGVTDERVTVTYKGGAYEVHRPGFSHGMHYNYMDDLHPVDCERCGCKHWRDNGRSSVLVGDPPSTCQCGHPTSRHRFRRVRQTLEICKAPEIWYPEAERILNALAGPS